MRILINDNIRSYAQQRGVTRCFWHITDGLIRRFKEMVTVVSPRKCDYGLARHIPSVHLDVRGSHRLQLHRLTDKWAEWISNRESSSVFFSAYYGNARPKAPEVFMVHDMIHALPEYRVDESPIAKRFRLEVKNCLERASRLIAVSHNTAADIIKCYPHITPAKVTVIHHGVDAEHFASDSKSVLSERPFFLFVGNREGYKNFMRLLTAFGESGLASDFDLRLIAPSNPKFTAQENNLINKFGLSRAVYFTDSNEVNLRSHYAAATAFVYPSEYEGFGLPILEAMAAGTIVLASNRSSIPEAGGDAAIYFDPLSVTSIAAGLHNVANLSVGKRDEFRNRGLARAREFTWERAVEKTVKVLEEFR